MGIRSYLSIITLSVSGLNIPTKRHRLAEWIKKPDPMYAFCKRHISDQGTHTDWKWGDGKRHSLQMEIKAKVAIHISDNTGFKIKTITRDKEGHMINGSIQEDLTIINILYPT